MNSHQENSDRMILAIDDCKSFPEANITALTFEEGLLQLREGSWDELILDHDLGGPMTGYDILVIGLQENIIPNVVRLVSMNPIGKERMYNILIDHGYSSLNMTDHLNSFYMRKS